MCYYQPNPPTCTCSFYQLIQPCVNATHYPPPTPAQNPNPLISVCAAKEFAKGVGIRICRRCQGQNQSQSHCLPLDHGRKRETGTRTEFAEGYTRASWTNGQGQEQEQAQIRERSALEKAAMDGLMIASINAPPELGTRIQGSAAGTQRPAK